MSASLRIGTWNLERPTRTGWKRPPAQLRLLREVDADVWLLTESRASLGLAETHPFFEHAPAHVARRPDEDERWASIWSRYPLRSAGIAASPRGTVAMVVEAPGGDVAVYATVVPWGSEPGDGPGKAKSWTVHARELERQALEWADLTGRFERVVVAGDFNMALRPGGYGPAVHRERHLALYEQAGLVPTTRNLVVDDQPMIDHILVSRSLLPVTSVGRTWSRWDDEGVRLSDHSGVLVVLQI